MKALAENFDKQLAVSLLWKVTKGVVIGAAIFFGLFVAILSQLPTC